MSEIKTCEQYVLAELESAFAELESALFELDRAREECESQRAEAERLRRAAELRIGDVELEIIRPLRTVSFSVASQSLLSYYASNGCTWLTPRWARETASSDAKLREEAKTRALTAVSKLVEESEDEWPLAISTGSDVLALKVDEHGQLVSGNVYRIGAYTISSGFFNGAYYDVAEKEDVERGALEYLKAQLLGFAALTERKEAGGRGQGA